MDAGVDGGVDSRVDSGVGQVLGISLPLPAAGDLGADVVGADADVGGVGEAEGGGGNSVHGVGSGNSSDEPGGVDTMVEGIGGHSNHSGVGLSLPLAVVDSSMSVGVSGVGVGGGV